MRVLIAFIFKCLVSVMLIESGWPYLSLYNVIGPCFTFFGKCIVSHSGHSLVNESLVYVYS